MCASFLTQIKLVSLGFPYFIKYIILSSCATASNNETDTKKGATNFNGSVNNNSGEKRERHCDEILSAKWWSTSENIVETNSQVLSSCKSVIFIWILRWVVIAMIATVRNNHNLDVPERTIHLMAWQAISKRQQICAQRKRQPVANAISSDLCHHNGLMTTTLPTEINICLGEVTFSVKTSLKSGITIQQHYHFEAVGSPEPQSNAKLCIPTT